MVLLEDAGISLEILQDSRFGEIIP